MSSVRTFGCSLLIASVIVFAFFLYVYNFVKSRECQLEKVVAFECSEYQQGKTAGSLCNALCTDAASLQLQCFTARPEKQVYKARFNGTDVVLKYQYVDTVLKALLSEEKAVFDGSSHSLPMEITSALGKVNITENVTDLTMRLLHEIVKKKFNAEISDKLSKKLVSIADGNGDGKVTTNEALAICRLASNQYEFLAIAVFNDHAITGQMLGYCGEIFAVEYIPLMGEDIVGTYETIADEIAHFHLIENWETLVFQLWSTVALTFKLARNFVYWVTVSWKDRADYGLGILDIVDQLAWATKDDPMYFCDMHYGNFGSRADGHILLVDVDAIFPRSALDRLFAAIPCQEDSDCQVMAKEDCQAQCDLATKRCRFASTKSALFTTCRKMLPRIFWHGSLAEFCPPNSAVKMKLFYAYSMCMEDGEKEQTVNEYRQLTRRYKQLFNQLIEDVLRTCKGIGSSQTYGNY
eukprot:m.208950 g.208950  ORF g.208950 m.208950 type:complete len:465 (+) comp39722_c0_seq14:84-1478(+)